MLRSGKHLATNMKNNTEIGSSANADETGESNSQPILLDDPDPKPSRENRKSTAEKNKEKTIDLEVEDIPLNPNQRLKESIEPYPLILLKHRIRNH